MRAAQPAAAADTGTEGQPGGTWIGVRDGRPGGPRPGRRVWQPRHAPFTSSDRRCDRTRRQQAGRHPVAPRPRRPVQQPGSDAHPSPRAAQQKRAPPASLKPTPSMPPSPHRASSIPHVCGRSNKSSGHADWRRQENRGGSGRRTRGMAAVVAWRAPCAFRGSLGRIHPSPRVCRAETGLEAAGFQPPTRGQRRRPSPLPRASPAETTPPPTPEGRE